MSVASAIESVLRHDRLVVLAGLAIVVAASITYTVAGVGMSMSALTMTRMAIEMPGMLMQPMVWTSGYALLVFFMWWVMMIAMMVPSAAPTILAFANITRRRENADSPYASTIAFLAGYLAIWAAFSLAAMMLQWGLEAIGVVTGMMTVASPLIAGAVLIVAGLYQMTPLKQACLKHCQHPVFFLMHHWRPKGSGAFRMGWEHGVYCLGCCWFLMALLFVGGIMNLLWVAGLALYVGVEKFSAGQKWIPAGAGIAMMVAGIILIARTYPTL